MTRTRRFTQKELEAMSVALYTLAEMVGIDPGSSDVELPVVESVLEKVWERQRSAAA